MPQTKHRTYYSGGHCDAKAERIRLPYSILLMASVAVCCLSWTGVQSCAPGDGARPGPGNEVGRAAKLDSIQSKRTRSADFEDDYTYYLLQGKELRHGKFRRYKAGLLVLEQWYSDGFLHGVSKTFDSSVGRLQSEVEYVADVKWGSETQYWDDGKTWRERIQYEKGVRHGATSSFFSDGAKEQDILYIEGKLNGPFISYFNNGAIKTKGQYKSDDKVGEWVTFDEKGNVVKSENFGERK